MSKKSLYYLVGRDRKSNDFTIIPVAGEWGNRLEEIDLYTTNYSNVVELIQALHAQKIINEKDMDFFIVSQKEKNKEKCLSFLDVLYKNSSNIRSIAASSLDGKIEGEEKNIHDILNHFCWKMKYQPLFYNMVVYGDTHLYPKFIRYFSKQRYQDYYQIKYQDGGWVRRSYPLLRNIVDSFHQFDYSFGANNHYALDDIFREMLEKSLLEVTSENYDEKQSSIFNIAKEVSDEEKYNQVMDTFQSLPRGVFYQKGNEVIFNGELFGNYDEGDFEKLSSLLGGKLALLIQVLSLDTYYYQRDSKDMKDVSEYEKQIDQDLFQITNLLRESPDFLQQAYQWSLLYQKYKNRIVGEKSGYQYRKK